MGLPIEQLIVATNQNDILHRCISDNDHTKKPLVHSLSPSMDIMVSSNFERLLFDLYNRDGSAINQLMEDFKGGSMSLAPEVLASLQAQFGSYRLDDEETLAVIADVYDRCEYLLDPHTAIGVQAARKQRANQSTPVVCLATAHPAKFPEAVAKACEAVGTPALPHHMTDLFDRDERYQVLAQDLSAIQRYMVDQIQ